MRIFRPAGILLLLVIAFALPASAATGAIQLNVHPGGGTVCIGTVCKDNPATADGVGTVIFDDLETGQSYLVNIFGVEGYKPYLKQIHLDPLRTILVRDITLEPLPAVPTGTASVMVYVTPDGSRVCLDRMCEVSTGDGTGSWSVEFATVEASKYHTLSVIKDGYETWSTELRLLPGQKSSLSVTLTPLPAGSATPHTPAPDPTATPEPSPTAAPLPGVIALLAVVACGALLLRRVRK